MTGRAGLLSDVLSGERPPGVYRWAGTASLADLRDECEAGGWRLAAVDNGSRAGLLRDVGAALDFPDWYGQNFDALADCLSDLVVPTVLVWDGWGDLARDDPQSYVIAVDVLGARAGASPGGAPAFVVLLRGEGPEVDPPWLS